MRFEQRVAFLEELVKSFSISAYSENLSFYESLLQSNLSKYGRSYDTIDMGNRELYFVDGAIGSGKSTLMKCYIAHRGISDLIYYSPDIFLTLLHSETEYMSAYNKAKDFLWKDMQSRIMTGESMIVEAVFTKEEKINFLRDAKKLGYAIIGLYVGTSGAEINVGRINARVIEGGFEIPREKILDRYNKSMRNLARICELSDEILVIDNSKERPSLVAYKLGGNQYFSRCLPRWARSLLPKAIKIDELD